MKLFALLVIALFAACAKSDEAAEMFKQIAMDCQASVGATDDDMASLMAHKVPSNEAQLCMIKCFLETEGVVKDNAASKEGIVAFAAKVHAGDVTAIATAVYDACKDLTGDGSCESAAKIGLCLKENGDKQKVLLGV